VIKIVNTFHCLRLKPTFQSTDLPQSSGGMGKGEKILWYTPTVYSLQLVVVYWGKSNPITGLDRSWGF